jgi:hypothetical protein
MINEWLQELDRYVEYNILAVTVLTRTGISTRTQSVL